MEQQELGKTQAEQASAELSELETAPETETLSVVDASDAPNATETGETMAVTEEPTTPESADSSTTKEPLPFKRGALIDGVITNTSPTAIVLDLGNGKEGIIQSTELERMDVKRIEDFVVGKTIKVVVINPRNKDGKTVVSYNHALEEADWQMAQQYAESKQVYHGKIGGYNKGGLIVRFGRLRGFVPQSQISDIRLNSLSGETPEQRYGQTINQTISVKVMEVDRGRNRLILSERVAEREVRQQRKEALITELKQGEERDGAVVSLENFGAFIDIGGAEGLVHLTELSHHHITHPRQVVEVGQKVRVRVIGVDPNTNRIALSMRALQQDPWDEIAARYAVGTLVRVTITKTAKFGAFARIEGADHVEGLIHISELSEERLEDPKEIVKKGDALTARVVKVDIAEKRLGLSLKRVFSTEYMDEDLKTAFANPDRVAIPAPKTPLEKARRKGQEIIAEIKEEIQEAREEFQENIQEAREEIAETLQEVREKGKEIIESIKERLSGDDKDNAEVLEEAREKGAEIIEDIQERRSDDDKDND
jgi:small subunit ribosomal protein S1